VVDVASEVLEDQERDQAASRITFSGRLDAPDIDIWSAIGSLLKNAFIEALQRGLDGSVDLEKVAGKDFGDSKGEDAKDSKGEAKDSKGNKSD
jgi:hypothetical protein